MRTVSLSLPSRDDGVTAAEYAVMLGLIVAVVIVAIHAVGDTSTGVWANDANKITTAIQSR
jgi:Flp pilus assembly pilin Flp